MVDHLDPSGVCIRTRIEQSACGADEGIGERAIEAQVWPLLAAGKVRPVIDRTFPLAEAAAAHARMESSQHIGKIVLVI